MGWDKSRVQAELGRYRTWFYDSSAAGTRGYNLSDLDRLVPIDPDAPLSPSRIGEGRKDAPSYRPPFIMENWYDRQDQGRDRPFSWTPHLP